MSTVQVRQDERVQTNWQRLHSIAEARRHKLGLTQEGLKELGGPSKSWLNAMVHNEGAPSTRHITPLKRLDAALRWEEGTAWDLVARDRSQWDPVLLEDEARSLIERKDKIAAFVYLIDRKLRTLPESDLRPAMLDIGRRLGIPVLDE
jgi:hypothetical protein